VVTADTQAAKIPVVLLYCIDPQWTNDERDEVVSQSKQFGDALARVGYPVSFVAIAGDNIAGQLRPFDPSECIVFNWCEEIPGIEHSEWLVAKKLEMSGYTFTGASSGTLELAQDKYRVKVILDKAAIPTPAWQIFNSQYNGSWNIFPAIVKPQNEHCSAGITPESVVTNPTELKNRISFVLKTYSQPALVEDFIDGREFRVSVLGNETLTFLPVAEMDFSLFGKAEDRLCTYEAKFIPGSQHYEEIKTLLPAPLTNNEIEVLQKICSKTYRATGCRDYARMDVRLRGNVFYVLDVNPNADISVDASMACAAETAGISYGQLGSLIIKMAAQRHPVFSTLFESANKEGKIL